MRLEQAVTTVLTVFAVVIPACSAGNPSPSPGLAGASSAGTASGGKAGASGPTVGGASGSISQGGSTGIAGTPTGAASGTSGTTAIGGAAGASAGAGAGGASGGGRGGTSGGGASGANSAGTSGTVGTSGASGGGPVFHVFLLLGQSNMAGYSKAEAADKVKDSRIKVLGFDACAATGRVQDKWDVAVPPLHECWNGALGPGDYFAKTLIDVVPAGDTIGLVPCAISGEKIETFLKVGGSKYSWIVQRAKLAQQAGGVIDGILFHQGESNCNDSSWPGKVNTLITDLRKDLNLGNAPFLAGELPPTGACSAHNAQVAKLPGLISNAFVVSAAGLALDPADTTYRLHFDHDSQVTFGKRYEATMVQALHW
jgi:hypothetical protein